MHVLPNDSRGFVHKKLLRAAGSFITGGPVAAAASLVSSGSGSGRRRGRSTALAIRAPVAAHTATSTDLATLVSQRGETGAFEALRGALGSNVANPIIRAFQKARGARAKGLATSGPCIFPKTRDIFGNCVFKLGALEGPDDPMARAEVGGVVMGRYGAAYQPGSQIVDRAVCLSGDLVADDGLCYPRGSITNRQRAWPKGRRPLLTGGEMRAISIAARAGGRLERAQKRLQKIGLMKKPAPAPRRKAITSGPTDHHHP